MSTACSCTDPVPFPIETENFSLTNNIEIVIIGPPHHYEMIRYTEPQKRLKEILSVYNVFQSGYKLYLVTQILTDSFKLKQVNFSDLFQRFAIYFCVPLNNTTPQNLLEKRLFDTWTTNSGANFIGTTGFSTTLNRYPHQMPSRFTTFNIQ